MLKGTTKIELTDVRTGKTTSYEKPNMVTNAVSDMLGMNPNGFKNLNKAQLQDKLYPIIPQLLGGILLCKDPVVEKADTYYVPNDNAIIGYANNVASPGTDPKRGSFNALESGKTEDGKGYRFVFDFATSQGNGEISALGLTSALGGQDGYGNMITNTCGMELLHTTEKQHNTSEATSAVWEKARHLVDTVVFDLERSEAVSVVVTGPNTLTVRRFAMDLSVFDLFGEPEVLDFYRDYADSVVTTTTFASYASSSSSSTYYYFTFLDGGDGYIWGFEHAGNTEGNASGDAAINWVKIKLDDLTVEEGSWTLPIQLHMFGKNRYYLGTSSGMYRQTCAIINNGKLYCVSNDLKGIYAIPLDNPAAYTYIPHPDGAVVATNRYYVDNYYHLCSTVFNKMYDTVYFINGYIQGNEIVPIAYEYNESSTQAWNVRPYGLAGISKPGLRVGPFLFCYYLGYYNYSSYAMNFKLYIFALKNYLATINNLEAPIIKTADKTMKITYTLNVV